MTSFDRILDVIDTGLQTPVPDPTFGECSPVNDDRCWRCQREPPADGSTVGVCEHCRRVLLDESGIAWDSLTAEQAELFNRAVEDVVEAMAETTTQVAAAMVEAVAQAAAAFMEVLGELAALFAPALFEEDAQDRGRYRCVRHGPQETVGFCRLCQRDQVRRFVR